MVLTSVCHPPPGPRLQEVRNPLLHQKEGTSQCSLCPSWPSWYPLAFHAQLTDCRNSILASHASADPSLQTLAVVGLENGEADPLQRVVAQTCNNPGKGSLGGSCTDHKLAGPEDHQCVVHVGAMWPGSFLLFPGP